MLILQMEHKVPNYEGWKKAFDSDPINRKKAGVKKYRIYRLADDPGYVIIDLYFDNAEDGRGTLTALQNLWNKLVSYLDLSSFVSASRRYLLYRPVNLSWLYLSYALIIFCRNTYRLVY